MTTDPNVADPVKLAAIKDALDRSGLAAKNAVSVEVGITKPWEAVFEGISQIIAGPRDPENPTAPVIESIDAAIESADAEIVGEIDDDEIGDYPPGIQQDWERESAEIVDVEIVAAEYTDASMSHSPGPTTPDQDQTDLSVFA